MTLSVPNGKRLLIFDFDGTIATLHVNWQALKRKMQVSFPSVDFSSLSRGIEHMHARCSAGDCERGFRIIRDYESEHMNLLRENSPICSWIREHQDEYLFAVCSSNMHATVIAALKVLKLENIFSVIVGSDDCRKLKPNPDALLSILEKSTIPASEAFYCGDTHDDLIAGKRADVDTQLISAFSPDLRAEA